MKRARLRGLRYYEAKETSDSLSLKLSKARKSCFETEASPSEGYLYQWVTCRIHDKIRGSSSVGRTKLVDEVKEICESEKINIRLPSGML